MANLKNFKNLVTNFLRAFSNMDLIALCIIIFFSVMIFIFGHLYHPIPNPSSADSLRVGILPDDAYRPLFYPILTVVLSYLVNDSFIAGRLISQISAILLIISSYFLSKKMFNEAIGIVTIILFQGLLDAISK